MSDNTNETSVYPRVAALGFVCGLRSMLGPALIAADASPGVKILLRVMSAGEMIADKLPKTPNRISPGPLAGRILSGTIVGAVVCRTADKSPWLGGLLGGAAAVVGSYGGYYARKALTRRLPDPVVAVAEDALALVLGRHFSPRTG